MSELEERRRGIPEGPGVLTGIRALRVEISVTRLVAERLNWSDHIQDPDSAPASSFTGTLASFNPDAPEGRAGQHTVALRRADDEGGLRAQIHEWVEKNGLGGHLTVSAVAPQTLRLLVTTFQEAGNAYHAVLLRIECRERVHLPRGPSEEFPVVIWAKDAVHWRPVAEPYGVLVLVILLLSDFFRAFEAQNAEYVRHMDSRRSAEDPPDAPAPPS